MQPSQAAGGGLPRYGSHKSNGQQLLGKPLKDGFSKHQSTQGRCTLVGITEEGQGNQGSINASRVHDVMVTLIHCGSNLIHHPDSDLQFMYVS